MELPVTQTIVHFSHENVHSNREQNGFSFDLSQIYPWKTFDKITNLLNGAFFFLCINAVFMVLMKYFIY